MSKAGNGVHMLDYLSHDQTLELQMFEKETIFVTGAGASVHYGYPTGAALLGKVLDAARKLLGFYSAMAHAGYDNTPQYVMDRFPAITHPIRRYNAAAAEIEDFVNRITSVDPIVIDYFLGQNLHLEQLGKLLVAWAILEAESSATINGNYIRHIVHQIAIGCTASRDLLTNNVKFLTFNYDTSLERVIRKALRGLSVFDEPDIEAFISSDRFRHVYGSVNDGRSSLNNFSGIFSGGHNISSTLMKTIEINLCHDASKNILVIDPANKAVSTEVRNESRKILLTAQSLVILGFGFDKYNTEVIGFQNLRVESRFLNSIYVTNFNGISRIDQSIGKTFLDGGDPLYSTYQRISDNIVIRESIASADGALSLDFDLQG